jgi:hypothetical protein
VILIGLEASDGAGSPVRVAARAVGSRVEFFVENEGVAEHEATPTLRGLGLALALARRLLASQGARVAVSHADACTRVSFTFSGARP